MPIQSRMLGAKSTPAIRAILCYLSAQLFSASGSKSPEGSDSLHRDGSPALQNSALALFVLRVDANYAHDPAPVDHLALITNLLYRCPDFHFNSLSNRPGAPLAAHPMRASRISILSATRTAPTYSDKRCAHESSRRVKAPPRLCLPPGYG